LLLATAVYRLVKQCSVDEQRFDVIDAHYFYPDGVAAALLGRWLSKPVTITARGTDINLLPQFRIPRKWIHWAAGNCVKIISVSEALRERLIEIGVDASLVCTLRNGVDLDLFRPVPDRNALRQKFALTGPTLLSVGHLIERKGHHLVIEALASLPDIRLMVVGDGPMRKDLEDLARKHEVDRRVTFLGPVQHGKLLEYYNAADALVLASSREGMANVLLESIACGTPVVATPYWGNPEVVADPRAGVLMKERTPSAIAAAVKELLDAAPERSAVRQYAESFSWEATTRGQIEIFREAVG
jgi:glycosyltransferase involved in cell wall biosynthesis